MEIFTEADLVLFFHLHRHLGNSFTNIFNKSRKTSFAKCRCLCGFWQLWKKIPGNKRKYILYSNATQFKCNMLYVFFSKTSKKWCSISASMDKLSDSSTYISHSQFQLLEILWNLHPLLVVGALLFDWGI